MFYMEDWRLREVLKDLGITQEKLAELLDCSKGQVSMLLSGDRKFHSEWIVRISKALKIPSWYLFIDPEKVSSNNELENAYKKAPEHIQKTINDLLGINK